MIKVGDVKKCASEKCGRVFKHGDYIVTIKISNDKDDKSYLCLTCSHKPEFKDDILKGSVGVYVVGKSSSISRDRMLKRLKKLERGLP